MTNTTKRILTGAAMVAIAGVAAAVQYLGLPTVRWLAVAVVLAMAAEFVLACRNKVFKKSAKPMTQFVSAITPSYIAGRMNLWIVFGFVWFLFVGIAAYFVGAKPWIMLLLLLVISAADIGAWFFGRKFGGHKMWEHLSAGKTWTGQIAGIICGAAAAVLYGLLGSDTFIPALMWIGIGIALLSQYGDLMASAVKRKLGIKDFSNFLPGHGGIIDRFDGWLIALPLVWLVML